MDVTEAMKSYVNGLVVGGHIRTEAVERAFARVQRHLCIDRYRTGGDFVEVPHGGAPVPPEVLAYVYADRSLVTKILPRPVSSSAGASLSAEMLEALELKGGERVLEIGAGTGYNAALLAEITGSEVVTVDHAPDVADQARMSLERLGETRVTVVTGEGYDGCAAGAPYDRVIVTVGVPGIAEAWLEQLVPGGCVVAPVRAAGQHPVLRVDRDGQGAVTGRGVCWTDFMVAGGRLDHHDVRLFSSAADWGPFTLADPRTVHTFRPRLEERAYRGLESFVSLLDTRAGDRIVEGLDPTDGACVIRDVDGATAAIQRSAIVVDGPDELAEHVLTLIDTWTRFGHPDVTDWCCELTLHDPLFRGRFWVPDVWTVNGTRLVVGAR